MNDRFATSILPACILAARLPGTGQTAGGDERTALFAAATEIAAQNPLEKEFKRNLCLTNVSSQYPGERPVRCASGEVCQTRKFGWRT